MQNTGDITRALRQRRRTIPTVLLGLALLLSGTLRADERITPGMTEQQVVQILGKPAGRMAMNNHTTLLYPDCRIELENGLVRDNRQRARAGTPAAGTPAAGPPVTTSGPAVPPPPGRAQRAKAEKNLPALMQRIRSERGSPLANAINDCDGPWAAAAIPLIAEHLSNTTSLEKFIVHSRGGRLPAGFSSVGVVAAEALANIGMQSWPVCMHILQNGDAAARANAARALRVLHERHNSADRDFPLLLPRIYEAGVMNQEKALNHKTAMARVIAQINTPEALATLHRSLGHPHQQLKKEVIRLLGQRRNDASIPLLEEIFLRDADADLREEAGKALAEYKNEQAARAAQPGLRHVEEKVRQQAAAIIGQSGPSGPARDLLHMFDDPAPEVRREALRALGHANDPESTVHLIRLLHRETNQHIAGDAANLLMQRVQKNHDPQVIEALLPGLQNGDVQRRKMFADLTGRTGAAEAYTDLARTARQDRDAEVRRTALMFLDNFENPEKTAVIIEALCHDPSPQCRAAALQTVKYGSLRHQQGEILMDIIRNCDPERALEATLVMSEMSIINRHPAAIAALIEGLTHNDTQLREQAAAALCREADIPQYSPNGKHLGADPDKWREWWRNHTPP